MDAGHAVVEARRMRVMRTLRHDVVHLVRLPIRRGELRLPSLIAIMPVSSRQAPCAFVYLNRS